MKIKFLNRFVTYIAITIGIILLYVHISRWWIAIGGGIFPFYKGDGPIVLLLISILYFDKIKNQILKHLLPTIPIIIVYLGIDIFYSYLERSPAPSDLQNFPLIFLFSPILGIGGLLIISCILLPIIFLVYLAAKEYTIKKLITILSYKILVFALIVSFLSTDTFIHYHRKIFHEFISTEKLTIQYNGRINSFIYYYGKELENKRILLSYKSSNVNISDALYPGEPTWKPNIHLIVLESFIDPRMIKELQFNRSPLANNLQQIIKDQGFSYVISPVYGGNTAQAEFELLTGIKALAKVESIEYNVLKGGEINGFVKNLKCNGYQAITLCATGPEFFNAKLAFRSLGIIDPVFLGDSDIKKNGDSHIFDGDLLDYNIKIIKNALKRSNKPIFNYVIGMYGHSPYARNTNLRPDVIQTSHDDEKFLRISNQFYYRTQAIGNYINTLFKIDPGSIIYITSDHLAPIGNNVQYIKDRHLNIALLFSAGEYINVTGKCYYEIPWLIWDILTEKRNDRIVEGNMESLYYKALVESL